jgi:hypothetical protein
MCLFETRTFWWQETIHSFGDLTERMVPPGGICGLIHDWSLPSSPSISGKTNGTSGEKGEC